MDVELASRIINKTIPLIRKAVDLYSMPKEGKILVGASGGKDSTFMALSLQQLGYEVECLIVDFKYPNFSAVDIQNYLHSWKLTVTICDIRHDMFNGGYLDSRKNELITNIIELDAKDCFAPCSACSRSKRTALAAYAKFKGIKFVALGHHREDFLATLLKDYFIYCYYTEYGSYHPDKFASFVGKHQVDMDLLKFLCLNNKASTMGAKVRHDSVEIIRPMLFIPELDIVAARDAIPLSVYSSGCSHAVFDTPQAIPSKREIVHSELLRRLSSDRDIASELVPLALSTISPNGSITSNPRSKRKSLLPGFD